MNKIIDRFTGKNICEGEESIKKLAEKYRASLDRTNLDRANLDRANLDRASLNGASLYRASLYGASLEFSLFPSIRSISSFHLDNISDTLILELMRRDADGHPCPEKFDEWAKGGNCPYKNEERFWQFAEKIEVWKSGKPQMSDKDLIIAICKEKGWGIRNYLKKEL